MQTKLWWKKKNSAWYLTNLSARVSLTPSSSRTMSIFRSSRPMTLTVVFPFRRMEAMTRASMSSRKENLFCSMTAKAKPTLLEMIAGITKKPWALAISLIIASCWSSSLRSGQTPSSNKKRKSLNLKWWLWWLKRTRKRRLVLRCRDKGKRVIRNLKKAMVLRSLMKNHLLNQRSFRCVLLRLLM